MSRFLIPAVLVVGAFFVYDVWRGPGRGGGAPEVEAPDRSVADADRRDARAMAEQDERIAALVRRIEQLEARAWEVGATRAAPPEPAAAPAQPTPAEFVPRLPAPYEGKFTEEELSRFHALQEAFLHQRRAEAVALGLARALDGLADPPSGDERTRILEESLKIWNEAESLRKHGAIKLAPADRKEAIDELRRKLASALELAVPGERGSAILKLVSTRLGIAAGTSLESGAGAKAEADNPRR